MFKICIPDPNVNSSFVLMEGVHIWHNDCVTCVNNYEGFRTKI